MMRRLLFALLLLAVGAIQPIHAQNPAPSSFAGLAFLLGTWDAVPDPISGTGFCEFKMDLQGHAIIRTNHADTPAANGRPAAKHDDLMVIYKDGDAIKADYWDNEDHVIRYVVTTPAANTATLLAPSTASSPGYKLSYTTTDGKTITGKFEFAAPGTSTFATYLSWQMKKR